MNNKFLQVRRTVKYLSIGVILQCFFYSLSAASHAGELDSEGFLNNLSVANVSLEDSGNRLSATDELSEADILVSGTITDDTGEPLPGVNILVKGTTHGTVTSIDGTYSLNVPEDATLVISFIGFLTEEVPVNGRSIIDMSLMPDILTMEEVVVVGYGTVKKSDLTGSVTTIDVSELGDIPANSVERLLQGRAAGLQVNTSSQDPGAGSTVRIRGGSSLRGSNSPLLVVDGFPFGEAGDLKQINPADIASIEVLKDASASAIYGSRGANGVIIVTTNKARAGTTKVNVIQQTTVSRFNSKLIKWTDPLLMALLTNEDMVNAGLEAIYNGKTNSQGVYHPSIEEIQSGAWPHNTAWDKVALRDAPMTNNTTVSISSANERTSFNLSLNYLKEQGVHIEDDYQKGIVNLGVSHKVFDNFTITGSNIFSKNFRNNNGGLAYWRNPLWPIYNEDGTYFRTGIRDFEHPLARTEFVKNESSGLDYITSYLFDAQLHRTLNLKSQINYKYGTTVSDRYDPKDYTEVGYFNNGAAYLDNWMGQNVLSETYLTYNNTFGEIHEITGMIGHSYEYGMQRASNLGSFNFINEALNNENMGAGDPERNTHSNWLSKTKLLSYIGRINYSLMDKYLFTATMRADGSSKFGANNKWAYFPSGAISWKAQNEEFIQNLGIFDELKVRASYGISGNQGISPYQTLSRYGTETFYDGGRWKTVIGPGYEVGRTGADDRYIVWGGIPNLDLKWETTAQTNIGLDLGFYNHRLRVIADYYDKQTSDLLRERLLSPSSSYDRMWVNDGELRNRGVELTIEGDIIEKNDLKFSSALIFSKNKNEIVSLGDELASGLQTDQRTGMKFEFTGYNFTQFRQSANILAIGQPINVFYGYKTDGIVQSLNEGIESGLSGELALPGEFKYVDLNGDGQIDINDRTIIGDPNPDFTMSLALDFAYKNIDLSVFLNGVYGNDVLYQGILGQPNVSPLRWTPDNPTNDYPSLRNGRQVMLSDWFIQDGSFLRVQNVTLGYNFNTENIRYISNCRLYVNASDLYTFTKFDGYDPEVGMDGIYWGGYPRFSRFTLGLNLTF